jgi:phage major head subunit gpT-like protein
MDTNRSKLADIFKGFSAAFMEGIDMAPDTYTRFCQVETSSSQITEYPFLEPVPGMREWQGERQIRNVSANKLTVKEREFEDTVSVRRRDVETDMFDFYGGMIRQLGLNAGKIWNDLAYEALLGNGDWLDGADFFSASRKYGKNTVCNKTTDALSESSFNTAYQTMMEYRGHNGKSLGVGPNLLIVGPKNRTAAWGILKAQFRVETAGESAAAAVNNFNYGLCDLLVAPELAGDYDDHWYLMDTRGALKPLVVQRSVAPSFTRLDRENDDNVFMRGEFIYGTRAVGAAFLSMPHLAYAGIL